MRSRLPMPISSSRSRRGKTMRQPHQQPAQCRRLPATLARRRNRGGGLASPWGGDGRACHTLQVWDGGRDGGLGEQDCGTCECPASITWAVSSPWRSEIVVRTHHAPDIRCARRECLPRRALITLLLLIDAREHCSRRWRGSVFRQM